MSTTTTEKCGRCEEPILPVILDGRPTPRLRGEVATVVRHVRWTSVRENWMARPGDRITATHTDVYLCDECWGALLSWVAEERREREVQRWLKEDT